MYATYQESQQIIADRKFELDKQQKFLATVNAVKEEEAALDDLHTQAQTALPTNSDAETLMLQLDGLLNDLSITASVNVPLTSEVSEGQTVQNQLEVIISGNIDYGKSRTLLSRLKSFARWNKIKSFSITKTGDDFSTSINFFVYFKPGRVADFSGDGNVMDKATQVFAQLRSYSTTPDSDSEGAYGRSNPFSP